MRVSRVFSRILAVLAVLALLLLLTGGVLFHQTLTPHGENVPPAPKTPVLKSGTTGAPLFLGDPTDQKRPAPPPGTVALTFDDGPDPVWTPRILDVLDKYDAKATFFIVGEQAIQHPELLRQIVRRGHEIGNHTFSHPVMGNLPTWRQRLEIELGQKAIVDATGVRPVTFRLPYSSQAENAPRSEVEAARTAATLGLVNAFTSAPTRDWDPSRTVRQIVQAATVSDRAGWTITMHDGGGADRSRTVRSAELIVRSLTKSGHRFVTVGELAGDVPRARVTAPVVDRVLSGVVAFYIRSVEAVSTATRWIAFAAFGLAILFVFRGLASLVLALVHMRRASTRYQGPSPPNSASVIVPAYNEVAGIADAVRSLANSDLDQYEIIVVDDGSTDGTADAVRALNLPRVQVITQENAGKPAALNRGIAEARYDTIVMVDADSMFAPDTLRTLIAPLADERVGAVSGNLRVANRRGLGMLQHLEYVLGTSIDRRAMDMLGFMIVIPGPAGAFRRSALEEVGGVPGNTMCEDFDLTLVLQRAGWKVAFAPAARVVTETPATQRMLFRQRYRWTFGTLQVLWKNIGSLKLRDRSRWAGTVATFYAVFFGPIGLSVAPVIDMFLLYGLLTGNPQMLAIAGGMLILLSILTAIALRSERDRLWHLVFVPLQYSYMRVLALLTLGAAVKNAVSGLRPVWRLQRRQGVGRLAAEQGGTK